MHLIWLIHLSTFFFFFSFGLVIPVIPIYLSQEYGVADAWIGWAVSLMPFAGILLRPWSGWLSDAWSRKAPTVIGLAVSSLAGLLYLGNLPLFLAGRLLQGLGIALYAPTSLAVTSDLVPDNKLTSVMSTRNLLLGVGVAAGTATGGWLESLVGAWLVFVLVSVLQAMFVPLIAWLVPETIGKPSRRAWWRGYQETLGIRPVMAATVGNFGFAAAIICLQAYYPLILSDAGYSTALVGTFFGFYSLVSIFFRLPVGYLADRFGAMNVALWGFSVSVAGFALLWFFVLPPFAFIAAALMGAGSGFYLPANLVSVSQAAPKEIRGSVFSLYTLSWDIGGVLGPGLGGIVVGLAGLNAALGMSTFIALTITIVYVSMSGLYLFGNVAARGS